MTCCETDSLKLAEHPTRPIYLPPQHYCRLDSTQDLFCVFWKEVKLNLDVVQKRLIFQNFHRPACHK